MIFNKIRLRHIYIEILYEISYFDAKNAEIDELISNKIKLRHIYIEILYEILYFDAKNAKIDELIFIKIRLRHIFIEIAFDISNEILLINSFYNVEKTASSMIGAQGSG